MCHYCVRSLCNEDFVIPRHGFVLVFDTLDLSVEKVRGMDVLRLWHTDYNKFINISSSGFIEPKCYNSFNIKWGWVSTNGKVVSLSYRDKGYLIKDFLDSNIMIVLEQAGEDYTDNVLIKRVQMNYNARVDSGKIDSYLGFNNLWLSDDGDGLKFSIDNFTDIVVNNQGVLFSDCNSCSLNEVLGSYLSEIQVLYKTNLELRKIIISLKWFDSMCSLDSEIIKGYLDYFISVVDFSLSDATILDVLIKLAKKHGCSKEVKARLSKEMFLGRG